MDTVNHTAWGCIETLAHLLTAILSLAGIFLLIYAGWTTYVGWRELDRVYSDPDISSAVQQTGLAAYATAKFLLVLVSLAWGALLFTAAYGIEKVVRENAPDVR